MQFGYEGEELGYEAGYSVTAPSVQDGCQKNPSAYRCDPGVCPAGQHPGSNIVTRNYCYADDDKENKKALGKTISGLPKAPEKKTEETKAGEAKARALEKPDNTPPPPKPENAPAPAPRPAAAPGAPKISNPVSADKPSYGLNELKVRQTLEKKGLNAKQQDAFLFGVDSADPKKPLEAKRRDKYIGERFLAPKDRTPPENTPDTRTPERKIEEQSPADLQKNTAYFMRNREISNLKSSGLSPRETYDYLAGRGQLDTQKTEKPSADAKWGDDEMQKVRDGKDWASPANSSSWEELSNRSKEPLVANKDFKVDPNKIRSEISQRKDVEVYLSRYPQDKRESVKSVLQSAEWTDANGKKQIGMIDERGNPKGDWSHDDFGRTLYQISSGADGKQGPVPADLSQSQPLTLNGGKVYDPKHKDEKGKPAPILEGPLGDMQKALEKKDFKDARAALEKADPLTKSIGNRVLRDAYVREIGNTLRKPESEGGYGITNPDDVKAIEVGREGIRNPDGSIREDLTVEDAEAQFRELGGFDPEGKSTIRPTKNQIKMDTAKYYRDHLPGEMTRMGMKGEDGAKYAASQGYLAEPEKMTSGTLGRMQKDYEAALKTRDNKLESDKLAKSWIEQGKNTVQPSDIEGDRYEEMKGGMSKAQKSSSEKDRQELEGARQRLYGADQQRKNNDPKQKELDLKQQELDDRKSDAAAQRNLQRDEMKQRKESDVARLKFEEDKAEKDRALQREQMQMQLISTLIQFMGSLFTTAMQVMGQTASAHISGQYQVQAAIMGKFKNS